MVKSLYGDNGRCLYSQIKETPSGMHTVNTGDLKSQVDRERYPFVCIYNASITSRFT